MYDMRGCAEAEEGVSGEMVDADAEPVHPQGESSHRVMSAAFARLRPLAIGQAVAPSQGGSRWALPYPGDKPLLSPEKTLLALLCVCGASEHWPQGWSKRWGTHL